MDGLIGGLFCWRVNWCVGELVGVLVNYWVCW